MNQGANISQALGFRNQPTARVTKARTYDEDDDDIMVPSEQFGLRAVAADVPMQDLQTRDIPGVPYRLQVATMSQLTQKSSKQTED